MPPERADLVLPSDIPNGERDVLIFYGLDIEAFDRTVMSLLERPDIGHRLTDCGDGSDDFAELEFVENGGFASGIEADLY